MGEADNFDDAVPAYPINDDVSRVADPLFGGNGCRPSRSGNTQTPLTVATTRERGVFGFVPTMAHTTRINRW
jgi:hypothetical protein